jgi:hypothetical protein
MIPIHFLFFRRKDTDAMPPPPPAAPPKSKLTERQVNVVVTLCAYAIAAALILGTAHAMRNTLPDAEGLQRDNFLHIIESFRQPTDRGLGDTVARLFAAQGAENITRMLQSAGIDCGCKQRQDRLNQLFPYHWGVDTFPVKCQNCTTGAK